MENQCSRKVQQYITSTKANIQLVNPYDHRVNEAEQAIQTWKNHWITGTGSLDPNCPIQVWCQFIEQGQDTLSMLQTSRVNSNPKLSAYAILEGRFNFDHTPMAPIGTKAMVFMTPNKRNTWKFMQKTPGMLVQPKCLTTTTGSTCLKRMIIESPTQPNSSQPIAKCQQ